MQRDLIETIKYGSKIFTEPDVVKKSISNIDRSVYAAALYNIFEAMKGLRIFDRFGFDLPKQTSHFKESVTRVVTDFEEWLFVSQYNDWLNAQNEQVLTDYHPSRELINLLAHSVDTVED